MAEKTASMDCAKITIRSVLSAVSSTSVRAVGIILSGTLIVSVFGFIDVALQDRAWLYTVGLSDFSYHSISPSAVQIVREMMFFGITMMFVRHAGTGKHNGSGRLDSFSLKIWSLCALSYLTSLAVLFLIKAILFPIFVNGAVAASFYVWPAAVFGLFFVGLLARLAMFAALFVTISSGRVTTLLRGVRLLAKHTKLVLGFAVLLTVLATFSHFSVWVFTLADPYWHYAPPGTALRLELFIETFQLYDLSPRHLFFLLQNVWICLVIYLQGVFVRHLIQAPREE